MNSDEVMCHWCKENSSLDGLIGKNTNQCPRCDNPMIACSFGQLKIGAVFIDKVAGNEWTKCGNNTAERDAASGYGYLIGLQAEELVYPY